MSGTRANRATGEVSYDVSLTNIGTDDLKAPLMLLLDPGRYFGHAIEGAGQAGADQSDLWILDLSAALVAQGGSFAVGSTLVNQTVTVVPASLFGTASGAPGAAVHSPRPWGGAGRQCGSGQGQSGSRRLRLAPGKPAAQRERDHCQCGWRG